MQRQGVVWIREEVAAELPIYRYTASWQPDPAAPGESFYSEDGPGWNDLERAIAWGRHRAPIVYVRVGLDGWEMYNAGELDDKARPPTRRWPGSRRQRARGVHPDYGGTAWVDEEHLSLMPAGRLSAWWGSDSGEHLEEAQNAFADVEEAIDWGRERAPVVLVAELPSGWQGVVPRYEIRSAGVDDPPGEPVERLRPRAGEETLVWEFSTQRAASTNAPEELGRLLEDALRQDPTVAEPSCRPRIEPMRAFTLPMISSSSVDELPADLPQTPPIRGWVDVNFRVVAPTRKRAFDDAFAAFHRAVAASGETLFGFTGNFALRAAKT